MGAVLAFVVVDLDPLNADCLTMALLSHGIVDFIDVKMMYTLKSAYVQRSTFS